MRNPFENRMASLNDPTPDIVPITPDDNVVLAKIGTALYFETGGIIVFQTASGATRSVHVGDFSILPVGVRKVFASGTTATGIHMFVATH